MAKHQVILGFHKSSDSSWLQLVIVSQDPKPGILALLELTEELLPGYLVRAPRTVSSAGSSAGSSDSSSSRLGASALRCAVYGGEAALKNHLQVLSRCLEAHESTCDMPPDSSHSTQ